MFELIGSKYRVWCTSFQSFEKFGARRGKRESSENWIFAAFLTQTRFLCVITNQFYPYLDLHQLQHEIHKLIPKDACVIITERPLGISRQILPCN